MGFRTILVQCDSGPGTPIRLKVALDLAGRFQGHVIGLFVRQPFQAPAFTDAGPAMDSLYGSYETAVKADEAMAAGAFRDIVASKSSLGEWHAADGSIAEVVIRHARYADLAIVGQGGADAPLTSTPSDLAEQLALAGERPVLIVPHIGFSRPPGGTVILCWNESREAVRAATAALPLLVKADKVVVLLVDPRSEAGREPPGVGISTWLVRHGVKATLRRDTAVDSDVGGVILSRAADLDADLVVMGLYGHSRMREWVLGGASRTLLSAMTVPLFVMH
jgi:nucleotide-binding universal stress UspA family protein